MVGTINTKSLLPKLSIMMLTQVLNVPDGFVEQSSLNGKYLKGITTAVTDPDVDIGNATHTHTSDGDHSHNGTVASHTHSGTSPTGPNDSAQSGFGSGVNFSHTHGVSSDSQAAAEASTDGAHTHNAFTNDLEHRTITFYKKTDTITHMSRKSLPRDLSLFYSKTGTLDGLAALADYIGKHIKGDATPGTNAGDNNHEHDSQIHNHPVDIGAHEHVLSFGGSGSSAVGGSGGVTKASGGHSHSSNTAATTAKSSTPVTSGNSSGHQHDDINHEPLFKTLQLLQVNSVKMSNVGVPKNCILLWLDTIALLDLVAGWQVSDGTNDTIDMLDIYPKGSATPDTTGGDDEHTHSEDTASHSHTGASVGHSHSTTGSSGLASSTFSGNTGGVSSSNDHVHSPGTVSTQAAQTITVTDGASNHDHGAENSEPEAKTVAFIERTT